MRLHCLMVNNNYTPYWLIVLHFKTTSCGIPTKAFCAGTEIEAFSLILWRFNIIWHEHHQLQQFKEKPGNHTLLETDFWLTTRYKCWLNNIISLYCYKYWTTNRPFLKPEYRRSICLVILSRQAVQYDYSAWKLLYVLVRCVSKTSWHY